MKRRLNSTMKSITILSLVFVFVLSAAWAIQHYSNSTVIGRGEVGGFKIVNEKKNWVFAIILTGSLDAYLDSLEIDAVEITAEMTEELVTRPDGTSYYKLDFTFGPSGAFFYPDAFILKIKGKYVSADTEIWLYDEYGEELPGKRNDSAKLIKFDIPHFSRYSYDMYDY